MKEFVKVMKALADPNRVKIIKLLQQKVMCVCELQGALGIAQPSVSKHLKILEEAGLVDYRKEDDITDSVDGVGFPTIRQLFDKIVGAKVPIYV